MVAKEYVKLLRQLPLRWTLASGSSVHQPSCQVQRCDDLREEY